MIVLDVNAGIGRFRVWVEGVKGDRREGWGVLVEEVPRSNDAGCCPKSKVSFSCLKFEDNVNTDPYRRVDFLE